MQRGWFNNLVWLAGYLTPVAAFDKMDTDTFFFNFRSEEVTQNMIICLPNLHMSCMIMNSCKTKRSQTPANKLEEYISSGQMCIPARKNYLDILNQQLWMNHNAHFPLYQIWKKYAAYAWSRNNSWTQPSHHNITTPSFRFIWKKEDRGEDKGI